MVSPILTDKPEAGDILSQSQSDLRNNFNYLKNALDRDHRIDFNVNTGASTQQGLHRQLSMFPTGSIDPPVTPGAQSMVFTSLFNLYVKNTNNLVEPVQLTNDAVGEPIALQQGYSWLPGGIVIQWGRVTGLNTPGVTVVPFQVPFTVIPFSIQVTGITDDISSSPNTTNMNVVFGGGSPNLVDFTISNSSTNHVSRAYWMAIGVV